MDTPSTAADVGLGNVNNTTDAAKPVSTATQTALDTKAGATTVDAPSGPATRPPTTPSAPRTDTCTVIT